MNLQEYADVQEYIIRLQNGGYIDPECKTCQHVFYPPLLGGKTLQNIFAPRHKPSSRCESGKHPHCTCDTCF